MDETSGRSVGRLVCSDTATAQWPSSVAVVLLFLLLRSNYHSLTHSHRIIIRQCSDWARIKKEEAHRRTDGRTDRKHVTQSMATPFFHFISLRFCVLLLKLQLATWSFGLSCCIGTRWLAIVGEGMGGSCWIHPPDDELLWTITHWSIAAPQFPPSSIKWVQSLVLLLCLFIRILFSFFFCFRLSVLDGCMADGNSNNKHLLFSSLLFCYSPVDGW